MKFPLAIAAGAHHSLALKSDGTVVSWGDNTYGQTNVPSGLTNVVAVATGFQYSLALKNDGTVRAWGYFDPIGSAFVPQGEQTGSIIGIGSGGNHCMVIRSKPFAPFILTEPVSQAKTLGSTLTFSINWVGLASAGYQWQFNGTNIPGATNSYYYIPSLQPAQLGDYSVVLSNSAGSITSSNAALTLTPSNPLVSIPGGLWLWGKNDSGQAALPSYLTDLSAVAGGVSHNVAVMEDSTVIAWGDNTYNQTNPPAGLTNVVSVAAGAYHNLALKSDGSIVPWGRSDLFQTNVPSDIISNAIAVSASGNMSLALLNDGTVRQWGETNVAVPSAVIGVAAIATGTNFNLALLSNGTVVPWGINNFGQTNVPTGLANVVAIAAGAHHALALKSDGTVVSWGDNTYGQTNVPSVLTNPATANVINIAAGSAHSMALRNDGTVIAWGDNTYGQTNTITNLTGVKAIAAGSYHSIALEFSPRVQYYPLTAAKDLLLIYNTNSLDSSNVMSYYLANRPMASSANVLGVSTTNSLLDETVSSADYANYIFTPITNWLAANPTKRPAYVILFLDVPSRIEDCAASLTNFPFPCDDGHPSVSYQIATSVAGWQPFVTHINMGATNTATHTNDCIGYINKLKTFGTTYSPGKLVISASAGGYGNSNYVVDGIRNGTGHGDDYSGTNNDSTVPVTTNGLLASGVSTSAIFFTNGLETIIGGITNNILHLTNEANVAGYISWGVHSSLGDDYAITTGTNAVVWTGNSDWWIIETIESFNGDRYPSGQGYFIQWFSPTAFGGSNYSNTPVGAVTHVSEPFGAENSPDVYFGLWAAGRNFAICAWSSRNTPHFQAVGDPLVAK